MRLQCRVTPAHAELEKHLEGIAPEYRAKRVIELANMMVTVLASGAPFSSVSSKATNNVPEFNSGLTANLEVGAPAPSTAKKNPLITPEVDDEINQTSEAASSAAIARPAPSWIKGAKLKG